MEKKTTENNEDIKEENSNKDDTFLSIVKVKINPELDLYLDSRRSIMHVECVNADAKKIEEYISDSGEVLLGRPLHIALELILTSAIDSGYLKENAAVSISLEEINIDYVSDYEKVLEDIREEADEAIQSVISDKYTILIVT